MRRRQATRERLSRKSSTTGRITKEGDMKQLLQVTALAALVGLVTPVREHRATVTVVMTGLDNPRGLALHAQGALFVAEAGRGGDGPCIVAGGETYCYGPSGGV